ncbi:MAG: hypothetical protein PF569_00200 [Candidatus Woesearchaeota archaeon]|jgi:Zn-dependent membrane protease YugP|nr:hypothetical protein [Candidatus Woesearchaeota archaeon]
MVHTLTFVESKEVKESYKNYSKRKKYIEHKLEDMFLKLLKDKNIPLEEKDLGDRIEFSKKIVIFSEEEYKKILEC